MTWIWAGALAVLVSVLVPRVLPRVALEKKTRLVWALPVAAGLGVGAGVAAHNPFEMAGLAVVAGVAAVMLVVDLYEHRLPDTLILAGLGVWAVTAVLMAATMGDWAALLRAALSMAAVFAGFFVLALLAGGMLGFGDVKLSALLGAVLGWYGWDEVGRGLFVAVILHGLAAVVVLIITRDRKADVPMGPALIAGAAVAVAISA